MRANYMRYGARMSSPTERTRSFWAWGFEEQFPDEAERQILAQSAAALLGVPVPPALPLPRLADVTLPPPAVAPPADLAELARGDRCERVLHSYGKSFPDQLRAFALHFASPPDFVLYPRDEADIVTCLRVCGAAGIAVVPFGGGTSVVAGVECPRPSGMAGVAALDLARLDRVLEIDVSSRAARIQAGASGPAIEAQLGAHGLTLRHFPQSFELSTLGGWLATRAGGHFATVYTHIDDLVQAVRLVTPSGIVETRRLPASGAGPAPERLFLGSEGALGIFSEAWLRLQLRPQLRSSAAVHFADIGSAVAATQAVAQAGLYPSNCRLLDSGEAMLAGAGTQPTLLLGFESAERPVRERLESALSLALRHGGSCPLGAQHREGQAQRGGDGSSEAWRRAFLAAPYRQSALLCSGFMADTFETACTWERFPALSRAIRHSVRAALQEHCGAGHLMMRFTHVYPDGPAPYFTYVAPLPGAGPGASASQILPRASAAWQAVKAAASEAISAAGGTITHHHAVGRTHRPWYEREVPPLFTAALRAAKDRLDPGHILNPGVLIGPETPPATEGN